MLKIPKTKHWSDYVKGYSTYLAPYFSQVSSNEPSSFQFTEYQRLERLLWAALIFQRALRKKRVPHDSLKGKNVALFQSSSDAQEVSEIKEGREGGLSSCVLKR